MINQNQAGVSWLDRELPDPADQREYARERAMVAVSESLHELLERNGITRTALAAKLNVSKSRVSHLLDESNLTLRTISDVLWACKLELKDMEVGPLGVSYPVIETTDFRGDAPAIRSNAVAVGTQAEGPAIEYAELPALQLCA